MHSTPTLDLERGARVQLALDDGRRLAGEITFVGANHLHLRRLGLVSGQSLAECVVRLPHRAVLAVEHLPTTTNGETP